jgi:hypothetical protein
VKTINGRRQEIRLDRACPTEESAEWSVPALAGHGEAGLGSPAPPEQDNISHSQAEEE